MISSPALFSACHDSGWRSFYLCLQSKNTDFYLTVEQGSSGNFCLKVSQEHALKVVDFFAAPAPSRSVTWKAAVLAWHRLSFAKSKTPGVMTLRIFTFTPLSFQMTWVVFPVEKLVQLANAWRTLT